MLSHVDTNEFIHQNALLQEEIVNLKSMLDTVQKRCDQYAQAYDSLTHQLKELLRYRFGKKSERFIDPESGQLDMLSSLERFAQAEMAGDTEEPITIAAHTRKAKTKSKQELPRRIEIVPVNEADKQCECGAYKTVIRYETKELLNYQPAIFEIIEQRREVVACEKGCDGQVVTAPAPLQVLPKVKVTESLLAFLVVSKLDDRQPLYHLEKQLLERHGMDCSRQTMARWLINLMEPMQPLYNLMKDQIIDYDIASCDATTLQVLKESGRRPEIKSYVYCMRGGSPDKSVILYDYNEKLHKQFVSDWFEGFRGYLHVDADNFFEQIGEVVELVNCNAHARRKFEPIAKASKGKGIAKEAMRFFKKLYQIEREAKDNHLSSEQRAELRNQKSKPLMDEFKNWLEEIYPTTLPQSPLGKALHYCIKWWPGLTRFLEDGRLDIDNNLTEQEIKPFVISRKNFLFAASVEGAKALCMHFGFIRTAKKHRLDPYHYYVHVLKALPFCKTVEDYEKLLPWNMQSSLTQKHQLE